MLVKLNLKVLRLHTCESTARGIVPKDYLLFLKGILTQSFITTKRILIRNQRRIQLAVQKEQLCAECGVKLKNFCLSKLLCICPFFSKKISIKKQSIASTEISLQFLAPKVPVFGKSKAAISSTSSYPFFSCNQKPCTW